SWSACGCSNCGARVPVLPRQNMIHGTGLARIAAHHNVRFIRFPRSGVAYHYVCRHCAPPPQAKNYLAPIRGQWEGSCMQIDGRWVPNGREVTADLCIVGAGAAGITIALGLAGTSLRIALVESGGFDLDPDTQALARGDSTGLPYFPLETARLRCFGG